MSDGLLPLLPVAMLAAGALIAIVGGRSAIGLWGSHLLAALGALAAGAIALGTLLDSGVWTLGPIALTPFATLSFRLDPLAAFFLLLISLVALAAAVYAPGYIAHGHGSAVGLGVALNAFVAAMMLVVLADSILAFLIAWELMSLVSFFLVVEDHHQPESRHAGFVYLTMTHVGGAFLVAALLALATAAGSLDFSAIRLAAPRLDPLVRDLMFLAALVGFGTKAGLIPLHVWLPRAHPAAPSYASALMSGVMLKMAVYGLLRVGWELTGPGPAWWGGLLLTLGVISAVLGVLGAMAEHDLKRLLAYSSVENVGIIFVGIGAGLLLTGLGQPALGAFALGAGLLHALNHAVFKGLLFLGAGAVLQATHTRNLELMGGLIKRMPWTAGAFLVGVGGDCRVAAAQRLQLRVDDVPGAAVARGARRRCRPSVAPSQPGCWRSPAVWHCSASSRRSGSHFSELHEPTRCGEASEVGRSMLLGMGLLAVACIGTRAAAVGDPRYARAGDELAGRDTGAGAARGSGSPFWVCRVAPTCRSGRWRCWWCWLRWRCCLVALLGGRRWSGLRPPWVCGIVLEPGMQYSAAALAKPIRIIFRALLRPYREIEQEHAASPHFVSGIRFEAGLNPLYDQPLYRHAIGLSLRAAHEVRVLQSGSLRSYLAYMLVTLVVALLLARPGGWW